MPPAASLSPTERRQRRWAAALVWVCVATNTASAAPPELSAQLLLAVNDYRQQQGLTALQPDAALSALAQDHSALMAAQRQLSHAGFNSRFERSGRRLCVENLAFNHRQAASLLAAWQRSPEHHANLLQPQVQRVGIALVDGYLTLLACTPSGS